MKSGEGCIRLRHMVTGYYLSTSESKVSMLTVDEAKVAKEAAGWLLSDAE